MKFSIPQRLATGLFTTMVALSAAAANQPPGYVDFGKFTAPGDGGEFVEVHVRSNIIGMVARLTKQTEPEVADLIGGLKLIRVNVLGLDDSNRTEMVERVKTLRADLETQGWDRLVTAQQKDEDVGVYVKTRGDEAVEGIVVTVLSGSREAVFINVVGDIKPEKLALLGERFNIEPLKKAGKTLEKS